MVLVEVVVIEIGILLVIMYGSIAYGSIIVVLTIGGLITHRKVLAMMVVVW